MTSSIRVTKQRELILSRIRMMRGHPTAEDMYEIVRVLMPRISLGTVYRNLEFLAGLGEIARLDGVGKTRRYDACVTPHAHACCTRCGRIMDVHPDMAGLDHASVDIPGFKILAVHTVYVGLCDVCRSATGTSDFAVGEIWSKR